MTAVNVSAGEVEAGVGAALGGLRRPAGSLFKVARGADGHGAIEDIQKIVVAETGPRIEVWEFRSSADDRARLDVTVQGDVYDWLRENAGQEMLPGLFRRNGGLVRVPRIGEDGWVAGRPGGGDDGPAQVRPLNAVALADVLQNRFWIYKETEKVSTDEAGDESRLKLRKHALVPREVCSMLIEGADEWNRIPRVAGVTHTPLVRADGTLLDEAGYDARSGLLYLPDDGLELLRMPGVGEINEDWVAWSRDTVNYLLRDFPFEQPRHRLNMIALLLTPLLRELVPPPYPMWLVNAHQRGSGKSLLAKVVRELHGGVHRPELPSDDDEIRKQITSVLMTTTAPVVNFDNVTGVIRSGLIANLLTTGVWSDRPLGRTDTVEAPNDRVWIATGNNISIGGDMARRVQWVSLDAGVARPEFRTGFAEKDLVGYVRANRGALLTALLVQVLWWQQCGGRVADVRSDDYSRWAGVVAAILEDGGLDEDGAFARGEGEIGEGEGVTQSEDEIELGGLLAALIEAFGRGVEFQVKDVREALEGARGIVVAGSLNDALPGSVAAARDISKALGKFLRRHERQFADIGGGVMGRAVAVRHERGGIVWAVQ